MIPPKLREKIKQLSSDDLKSLFFELLIYKKVSFVELSELYVKYLETLKENARDRESKFAIHLSRSFSYLVDKPSQKDRKWWGEESAKLLDPHVPHKFLKEYVDPNYKITDEG